MTTIIRYDVTKGFRDTTDDVNQPNYKPKNEEPDVNLHYYPRFGRPYPTASRIEQLQRLGYIGTSGKEFEELYVTNQQVIDFKVTEVETRDLFIGEREVAIEGKDGLTEVDLLIGKYEGETVYEEELARRVINRVVNELVYVGTRKRPEPEPEPEPEPDKTTILSVKKNGENWESDLPDIFPIISEYPITINFYADDGYEFKGMGEIIVDDNFNTTIGTKTIDINGNRASVILDLPTVKNNEIKLTITLNTVFIGEEQVSQFLNVYEITENQLNQISHTRFSSVDDSTEGRDYGEMIINLMTIPFDIPSDMVNGYFDVMLGMKNTNVKAKLLNGYELFVDLGEINVTGTYENVLDYANVTTELYLPLLNSIVIDVDYVMNETLSIEYIINLYTGETTVNLYSTFTDSLFHSENQQIGKIIPFATSRYDNISNTLQANVQNRIKKPYVIVIKNVPIKNNNTLGVDTLEIGVIGDYTGYIEVSDIDLDSKATKQEQSEIESLLKQGVYINE